MKKAVMNVLLGASCFLIAAPLSASFYIEEPLSFGTIIIRDNTIPGSVTVPAYGHPSSSGGVLILKPGSPAELIFNDYPPYMELTVTPMLPVETSVVTGDTEQFTLGNIDLPKSIITDSKGVAKVKMGGTLETSGAGGNYLNTDYKAVFYLDINY